jgi:hypothetical protein
MTSMNDEWRTKTKRAVVVAIAVMLAAAPGLAQEVTIDCANGFDFNSVTTFQDVDTEESNIKDNPMMADRVVSMIKQELREGGLQEVQENPDLYVTYHFTSQERKQLSTTSMGMSGWGGSGTVTVKDKPENQVKQVEKILE